MNRCVQRASKYRLLVADGISITRAEVDKIDAIDGVLKRKVMFSMLCVAKYFNLRNPDSNNNWINVKIKDVFSMANVTMTVKRQYLMINDLIRDGYLKPSVAVDNTNLNVQIVDDDSETVLVVSEFRNLGNQYMMFKGENYIVCADCGAIVRRTSNSQKYCRRCSEIEKKSSVRDRVLQISNTDEKCV